jgi:hypothetical protein
VAAAATGPAAVMAAAVEAETAAVDAETAAAAVAIRSVRY